ncbi:MAG: hypothetical protein ACFCU8_13700 [Thermosynechococcaceae cyanobacterium]
MEAVETEQQYEGAILNQLIKNSERLAVLEQNVGQLKTDVGQLKTDMAEVKPLVIEIRATMNWVKWFLGAIAIGILGDVFSQPILSALHLS